MKTKGILFILCIMFACTTTATAQVVAYGNCGVNGDNLTWQLTKDSTLTINGGGDMANWAVSTPSPWSYYKQRIKTIVIGNYVTSIGNRAFVSCRNLKEVTIGTSVTRIGDGAFSDCRNLTSVTIPNSVKTMGGVAFSDCVALLDITIPNSVTTIGSQIFNNCDNLTNLYVSWETPPMIHNTVFAGVKIKDVKLHIPQSALYNYQSADVWQDFLQTKDITKTVTDIPKVLPTVDTPKTATVAPEVVPVVDTVRTVVHVQEVVPVVDTVRTVVYVQEVVPVVDTVRTVVHVQDVLPVVDISKTEPVVTEVLPSVDPNKAVTVAPKVSTPESTISIPSGTTDIVARGTCGVNENNLIWWLTKNGTLTISGDGDMKDWELVSHPWFPYISQVKKVIIQKGVTSIGAWAFFECKNLTSVSIPTTVTSIRSGAFCHCSKLEEITIPGSVTKIENYVFDYCSSLKDIYVDYNNPSYSSLKGILYSKSKDTIVYCPTGKPAALAILNTVTTIGSGCFYQCSELKSLIIPTSVTSILSNAFDGCINLSNIYAYWEKPPKINADAFYGLALENISLYVPRGMLSAYQNVDVWKDFKLIER